ncbi:MAG: hypothetical protein ACFFC6_00585 [Promethearchaeota archaeon]
MTSPQKPVAGTTISLSLILLLFFAFLFSQTASLQSSVITSVLASRNSSSYHPRAFRSDSGQTHLLFLHQTQEYDQLDSNIYHSYELEDRSWAVPVKLEDLAFSGMYSMTNFLIIQNESREDDFSVYFSKEAELFKMTYDGKTNQWSGLEELFSEFDMSDYLQASIDHSWIHSLFHLHNGAINVVWSFENQNHEYEKHYILSTVFSNGTIQSQVIPSTGSERTLYHRYSGVNFVARNSSLLLYSPSYLYRSILLPNDSWSTWQPTGLHGEYGSQLIHNRYLLTSDLDDQANLYWTLTDLTATNLSVHLIEFPIKIDPQDKNSRATFKLLQSLNEDPSFITTFVTNSSIELWTYDLLNNTWIPISQLAYSQKKMSVYSPEEPKVFNIDLLADGSTWRVFWNQQVNRGNFLHELFTVSYHTDTGKWSQVTQITDTRDITDDFTGEVVPGFPLVILFLSFLITVVIKRK